MTTFSHLPPSSTAISSLRTPYSNCYTSWERWSESFRNVTMYYRSYPSLFAPPTFCLNNFVVTQTPQCKPTADQHLLTLFVGRFHLTNCLELAIIILLEVSVTLHNAYPRNYLGQHSSSLPHESQILVLFHFSTIQLG